MWGPDEPGIGEVFAFKQGVRYSVVLFQVLVVDAKQEWMIVCFEMIPHLSCEKNIDVYAIAQIKM